jgi:hypothetical protein
MKLYPVHLRAVLVPAVAIVTMFAPMLESRAQQPNPASPPLGLPMVVLPTLTPLLWSPPLLPQFSSAISRTVIRRSGS